MLCIYSAYILMPLGMSICYAYTCICYAYRCISMFLVRWSGFQMQGIYDVGSVAGVAKGAEAKAGARARAFARPGALMLARASVQVCSLLSML